MSKKTWWLLLLAFFGLVAAALFLMLPIRGVNLTTGTAGWASSGCFANGGFYATTGFERRISAHERQGITLWGSYCGGDADTGELHSSVFQAPAILELFVAGYPGSDKPGLQLALETEDTHRRLPLPASKLAGGVWVKLHWWLPKDWRGQRVRLIAIDHESSPGVWLGVSNPRSLSILNFVRLQWRSWCKATVAYLYQIVLFLLPGFAVACLVIARRDRALSPVYLVMIVICVGSVLGYISFWAFFFSKGIGRFLSFAVYLTAIGALLIPSITPRQAIKTTARLIRQPILLTVLAGLCYTSFYFAFEDPFLPGIGYPSDRFFAQILAADNVIPEIFADRIWDRKPLIPFCCNDWLSSDRPPLQAGIVLLERPLREMSDGELSYQLLSSGLQCFWICGVWCLLVVIGSNAPRIRQVLGFLIFSGFLFYNSVYAWPKLLSATYILFLLCILFEINISRRRPTRFEAVLAAICLGLALMAHPGATFSLAVFLVLLVRIRKFITLRQAALVLALVVAFYLPWSLYQKYVDPPGNRLLKMHLGGVMQVDSRTTWQAISDTYRATKGRDLVYYKWLNIAFLAGKDPFDSYGLTHVKAFQIDHEATERSRTSQRYYMWNAVGLVNAGWLAGLFLLVKRRRLTAIPYAWWLIAAALANLVFWSVITFGPFETQTAHSSYADILLVSIGLLGLILALPRIVFALLFLWQIFNFFVVWVWSAPARIAQPYIIQWPMILMGTVITLYLLWFTWRQTDPEARL